jgi:hypothetical protein
MRRLQIRASECVRGRLPTDQRRHVADCVQLRATFIAYCSMALSCGGRFVAFRIISVHIPSTPVRNVPLPTDDLHKTSFIYERVTDGRV